RRDCDNRSRGRLDEARGLWFWRYQIGPRHRIFRVCPAELLVRGAIDFVAERQSRNVRSDTFDDSRELGTENQKQGLEFQLALTDESIPVAHSAALTRSALPQPRVPAEADRRLSSRSVDRIVELALRSSIPASVSYLSAGYPDV